MERTSHTAYEEFRKVVKGQNIMTPGYILAGWVKGRERVYELTNGSGFTGEPIYGVAVVDVNPRGDGQNVHRHDLSRMVWSEADAATVIHELEDAT